MVKKIVQQIVEHCGQSKRDQGPFVMGTTGDKALQKLILLDLNPHFHQNNFSLILYYIIYICMYVMI